MSKQITIGLDSSCVIRVNDPARRVSRRHATLHIDGQRIVLEDHSSNGTTVNGNKIHHATTEIRQGDDILLGNTVRLSWREIEPFITQKAPNTPSRKRSGSTIALIVVAVIITIGVVIYIVDYQTRMCEETYVIDEDRTVAITYEQGTPGYRRDDFDAGISISGPYISSPKLTVYCDVTNTSAESATFTMTATITSRTDGRINFSNSQHIAPGATIRLSETKEISGYTFEGNVSLECTIDVSPKTKTITVPVTKTRMVKCKDLR